MLVKQTHQHHFSEGNTSASYRAVRDVAPADNWTAVTARISTRPGLHNMMQWGQGK